MEEIFLPRIQLNIGVNTIEINTNIPPNSFKIKYNNSEAHVIDEEITTDEYFENKPNDEIKPISVITLRSSEIKASGQSIYNDSLIEQYGTNELIIEEDYIAYTDTLRNAFLEGATALFGLTYKPLSIQLLGNVYLDFNDMIKVVSPQGEEYITYSLNNIHEYNGTLYNTITAPALTDVEEKYKYETEDKTFRRKTAAEIDKANGKIALINSQIGDRSHKESTITDEIDKIELKISDIEDLTVEITQNNPLKLENCVEGNLLQLKIKGNNTVFSGLVPSEELVPSDNLVPYGDSILRVYTNNLCPTKNEQWKTENLFLNDNVQTANTGFRFTTVASLNTTLVTLELVPEPTWGNNYYLEIEPNHRYKISVNIEAFLSTHISLDSFTVWCATFDQDVFNKMQQNPNAYIISNIGVTNVSFVDGEFISDITKTTFEFQSGVNDKYLFLGLTINNAWQDGVKYLDIIDLEQIGSLHTDLIEIDKDYISYFSIKNSEDFVLTELTFYDSDKNYLSDYYSYYSREIVNGLNSTELVFPPNTKYISLMLSKKDSQGNFINFNEYNIEEIQPMLEYVTKYKNNNTYSGQLPNSMIELDRVYNYGYYHIPNVKNLKATDTTEFELEYIEYENENENSVILGSDDNGIILYTKTNGLSNEHPYNEKKFIYNGTEYSINTENDYLNIKTRVSFKLNNNTGKYVLRFEDVSGNLEEFSINPTTTFESTETLHLFSNGTLDTRCNIGFYNLKVWQNDNLVLNYIPEMKRDNNYIGLYEVITNTITSWNSYLYGLGSGGIKYFVVPESQYQNHNNQIIDLGIEEPLRQYSATVYDEFIYDYEDEDHKAYVIRRVGVTSNGTLYELANEVIEVLNIPDILLTKGNNYIDLTELYIANMYARYVQINEFTKIFATTYEIESAITQLANRITLLVREKVNKEEVIAELNLEISEGRGIVKIIGNQVVIDSDYFHLTADGRITAIEGYIAGFEMWRHALSTGTFSGLTKTYTTSDTSRDSEGKYVNGILIPDSVYGSDFIIAGMPYDGGGWSTAKADLRILSDGVIYCKRINLNGESGYVTIRFDNAQIAMELKWDGIYRYLSNGNFWAKLGTLFNGNVEDGEGILIHDAQYFSIYDDLHKIEIAKFSRIGNQGQTSRIDFYTNGYINGYQIQTAQSDERIKDNIEDCEVDALPIINKIRMKQFDWNKEKSGNEGHVDIGFIAQEIEKEYDKLVIHSINPNGDTYGIDLLNTLALSVKAIQELSNKVDELENEIKKLKGEE